MTSLDELKQQLLNAEKEADKPKDKFHETARKLVNIERQSFYGDDSLMKRLGKIREEINKAVKEGASNEI